MRTTKKKTFWIVATMAVAASIRGTAEAANSEDTVLSCLTTNAWKELEKKFPEPASRVPEPLTPVLDGSVCYFSKDLDNAAPKLGADFSGEIKKVAKETIIPAKSEKWSCIADPWETLGKYIKAYRFTEQGGLFRTTSSKKRGYCYSLAALDLFKDGLGPDFMAEVMKGDPMTNDELMEERAMPYDKIKYEKYKVVTTLPKAGMRDPGLDKQMHNAAVSMWAGSGIAAKAKVQKCVITGSSWENFADARTNIPTRRVVRAACAVEIDPNVCVIFSDGCEQSYLGFGKYSVCRHQGYKDPVPSRIDCAKAK